MRKHQLTKLPNGQVIVRRVDDDYTPVYDLLMLWACNILWRHYGDTLVDPSIFLATFAAHRSKN